MTGGSARVGRTAVKVIVGVPIFEAGILGAPTLELSYWVAKINKE